MPHSDFPAPRPSDDRPPVSALATRVLQRLPAAERERAALRRRQRGQRLAAGLAAALFLGGSFGFQGSDLATRSLGWLYAAAVAWKGLVQTALGGFAMLPVLSACCLLGMAIVLWQRVLNGSRRGLP